MFLTKYTIYAYKKAGNGLQGTPIMHTPNKGFVYRVQKELLQSVIKRKTTQFFQMGKRLNRQFTKKMHKWSISTKKVLIGEMQI